MRVTHTFTLVAKCPEDGATDCYEVSVAVDRLVRCEDVLAAAEAIAAEGPVHQETLTRALAARLGATVRTVGSHCGGRVVTTCEAAP